MFLYLISRASAFTSSKHPLSVRSSKNKQLEFHKKLRTLTYFDPTCGCGNFLVIAGQVISYSHSTRLPKDVNQMAAEVKLLIASI